MNHSTISRLIAVSAAAAALILLTSGKPVMRTTLVRTSAADPCLVFDGSEFFLTMTGSTKIALVSDRKLSCLTTADHPTTENIIYDSQYDPTVDELFGEGAQINGTWSPELHYFSEEEFPGKSGWYLYFALRQKVLDEKGKVSSRNINTVILKSASGSLRGPWVHPVTGVPGQTQPLLEEDGSIVRRWVVGASVLRIPSGSHAGSYITWVEEEGRGQGLGKFFQKIMISKFSAPWQLQGGQGVITTPTQEWEFHGSSQKHPRVVEGGTAVYGDNGEVFMTYSGSGFWSDYGLGQLTLKRHGDEYEDPLLTESWIKYERNPVFTSVGSEELRGAGHGFFLKDAAGNRFVCFHAYPVVDGKKAKGRNAYIEPYSIDKSAACPTAPDGVLRFGIKGNGKTSPVESKFVFVSK